MIASIAEQRLLNQRIGHANLRRAADVVAWLGAVQAQEYAPAKWAIGLRMRDGIRDADIERDFADGEILRTHVMRPTWHFIARADIRWLVGLTGPRVQQAMASYTRTLDLDARTLSRCFRIIERALRDRQFLTRNEIGERLRQVNGGMTGPRLAVVMAQAECALVVCSGPRKGRDFTYALVEERAPGAHPFSRDEALATLGQRFFSSHGPATARDFAWWSGLTMADVRRALDMIKARRVEIAGLTYWMSGKLPHRPAHQHPLVLLPIYDEYLVAYRDRAAVPHLPPGVAREMPSFQHSIVAGGQVAGIWRPMRTSRGPLIRAAFFGRVPRARREALAAAVDRYARFAGVPVEMSLESSGNTPRIRTDAARGATARSRARA